jgi:hypothetical protein
MTRYLEVVRTFARKDFRIAWSYRGTFVVGAFGIFYQLVIFRFVSKLVGGGRVIGTPDDYFRYVVVGIILTGVLRAATTSAAANARRDQVEGTLEALAAQPMPVAMLGLGWSVWPVCEAGDRDSPGFHASVTRLGATDRVFGALGGRVPVNWFRCRSAGRGYAAGWPTTGAHNRRVDTVKWSVFPARAPTGVATGDR